MCSSNSCANETRIFKQCFPPLLAQMLAWIEIKMFLIVETLR